MLLFTGVSLMILLSYSALSLLWDVEDLVLLLAAFIQLQQIDAYTYEDSNPDSKRNWEDWGESAINSDSHSVHSTASRLPTASTDDAETTIERASEVVQHIRAAIEAILKALQERVDRHVNGEIDKELGGWLKMRGEGGTSGKGGKGKGYDIIG
ncbi:hypothetical protein BT96DRAFT_916698 [Gymnopus androsaceus JB14]|uniref:Uncharacterized protein n=1 Tax=Gymnopus androsaceus JB14 TaxID=1447944 RepID=A0A6A4HYW1_9AGAR|nr:hypothetical protein BT96DRAFT_916698 [Gymnopus androsaceus JB14]